MISHVVKAIIRSCRLRRTEVLMLGYKHSTNDNNPIEYHQTDIKKILSVR